MKPTAPHYLLFTEAKNNDESSTGRGRWRFVLEQIGTSYRIEEADDEPGIKGERLQLLAVVRGLEALEQRSNVTLITSSKYVGRGIRRGLTLWRQNDWHWERFGQMALIKNHDLWKRIDQAMKIHNINCRVWQFDPPHVRTQVVNEVDEARLLGAEALPEELLENSLGIASHGVPVLIGAPTNVPTPISNFNARHSSCRNSQPGFRPKSLDKTEEFATSPGRSNSTQSSGPDFSVLATCNRNPIRESVGRGNHLTLNLEKSRKTFENTIEQVSRVSNLLSDKVKPIGQGKAFGYALS
ncbi:MAG: ribonuclease HI [Mariniblastus sp.]|jgi:ribonuclease HI